MVKTVRVCGLGCGCKEVMAVAVSVWCVVCARGVLFTERRALTELCRLYVSLL